MAAVVAEAEEASADMAGKIEERVMQVSRVQDWWSSRGPAAVSQNSVISAIDAPLLAEIVASGGGYHTILTPDRLDGLHRQFGTGTDPALEHF